MEQTMTLTILEHIQFRRNGEDLVGFFSSETMKTIGREIVISIGKTECLLIYTPEQWHKICSHIQTLPPKRQKMLRPLLKCSAQITVHSNGSWTLPGSLADIAHIVNEANICRPESPNHASFLDDAWVLSP